MERGGRKGRESLKPQNPGAPAPDRGTGITDITVHPLPAPHPPLTCMNDTAVQKGL